MTDFVEGPDDDDDDVLGVDTDGHSISLPARLLRGLANETNNTGVTVISAFYRNMSGLLPGNLPGGDGSVELSLYTNFLQLNSPTNYVHPTYKEYKYSRHSFKNIPSMCADLSWPLQSWPLHCDVVETSALLATILTSL